MYLTAPETKIDIFKAHAMSMPDQQNPRGWHDTYFNFVLKDVLELTTADVDNNH